MNNKEEAYLFNYIMLIKECEYPYEINLNNAVFALSPTKSYPAIYTDSVPNGWLSP